MDIKENYEALYNMHLPIQPPLYYPFDAMAPYAVPSCYAMEINGARRKNATRETTSALKAWLNDHRKNPYPTKGEKIMLAVFTKMTLTQVSTWFANARRRLKKENKMTWSPRNRCDDDDDFIDDEPLANSANDKCSSRSANVSSVQQQNNMLQIKNDSQTTHQQNNQHSSSSATTNLNDITHPVVHPFALPNGLSNLPNGLTNSSALAAQQQLAGLMAAANQLPPQLAAQLTPQQQLLLSNSDPNGMAAFMQQQIAALHHQQLQHLNSLNNNIKPKIEEDSSEIVDIEDNSNMGSLSDSDSINQSSSIHHQSQFNQHNGLHTSNHNHQSNNNHQIKPHQLTHQPPPPPPTVSQSAASLLHHSQNSSLNHLSNLHSHIAAMAGLNPSVLNPTNFLNAANAAAALTASSLSNVLSPLSKSTQANLQKPKIWSIVDITTDSTAANLLESSHLSKDKNDKKLMDNLSSSALKVPSVTSQSTGISISSPNITSLPTTITNTTSVAKK